MDMGDLINLYIPLFVLHSFFQVIPHEHREAYYFIFIGKSSDPVLPNLVEVWANSTLIGPSMSLFDNIFGWCLPISGDTQDARVDDPDRTPSEESSTKQARTQAKTVYEGGRTLGKAKCDALHATTANEIAECNTKDATSLRGPPNEVTNTNTEDDTMSSTALPDQPLSKRKFQLLPKDVPVEEENNTSYSPITWYSVLLGEVLVERYQILTKLGYGDTSTVWLAYDNR